MMLPSLAIGMKFPDSPLGLGLKYHEPPPILPSIVMKLSINKNLLRHLTIDVLIKYKFIT